MRERRREGAKQGDKGVEPKGRELKEKKGPELGKGTKVFSHRGKG